MISERPNVVYFHSHTFNIASIIYLKNCWLLGKCEKSIAHDACLRQCDWWKISLHLKWNVFGHIVVIEPQPFRRNAFLHHRNGQTFFVFINVWVDLMMVIKHLPWPKYWISILFIHVEANRKQFIYVQTIKFNISYVFQLNFVCMCTCIVWFWVFEFLSFDHVSHTHGIMFCVFYCMCSYEWPLCQW